MGLVHSNWQELHGEISILTIERKSAWSELVGLEEIVETKGPSSSQILHVDPCPRQGSYKLDTVASKNGYNPCLCSLWNRSRRWHSRNKGLPAIQTGVIEFYSSPSASKFFCSYFAWLALTEPVPEIAYVVGGGRWPEVMRIICWNAWKWRCGEIFENVTRPIEAGIDQS